MANNKIQIKRSTSNATVTGLSNGELAFTQAGNVFFIGAPDGVSGSIRIGGQMVPGVLTANQALVANATSGIDKVITANASITSIWANGSAGAAGDILFSNSTGIYWASGGQVGVNVNATYAWTNVHTFSANVNANTVNATSFTTGATGTGTGGSVQNTTTLFIGNNTLNTSISAAGLVVNGTAVIANNSGVYTTGTVNGAVLSVGTSSLANSTGVFTTGTVNGATLSVGTSVVANSTRLAIGTGVGVQANGGIGTAGQVLTSNATTVYWSTPTTGTVTSVASGNGITGGTITSTGTLSVLANNGIVANTSGLFAAAANGISVTAAGINVTGGDGLVSNVTGVHVVGGNGISVSADAVAVSGGSTLTVNATGVHVNSTLSIQDLTLSGNLTVLGDLVSLNVATLSVEDSMITLAKDQSATATFTDAVDVGFFGTYGNTANAFISGLIRDQSDSGIWKLFTSNGTYTNTIIDTANTNAFKLATLQAFITSGGLTTNSTSANLIANSTYTVGIVANSLTLSTALIGTSGGTGKSTVTNNALLVGNSTNGYNELTLGTSGYVLQSNGTAIVYDTLDGGTF